MKKILIVISSLFLSNIIVAQAPQLMSYQAVLRNLDFTLIANQQVGVQVSILQGSDSGNPVFIEKHIVNTNINGLVSLKIGGGIGTMGSISGINWGFGPYFIKIETDPTGGENYTISGVSQLLSVPYALFDEKGDSDWVEDTGRVYTSRDIEMEVNGNVNFSVKTTTVALKTPRLESIAEDDAIWGISTAKGVGVYGGSIAASGVFGHSDLSTGVRGVSLNGDGVYGRSWILSSNGVFGKSDMGVGVYGESTSGAGVKGLSDADFGVYGKSTLKSGVYGISDQDIGVHGASELKIGVYGNSKKDKGVHGESMANSGVYGNSMQGNGVEGNSIGATTIGVFGKSEKGIGVKGESLGLKPGVSGFSKDGNGVIGNSEMRDGVHGGTIFKMDHELILTSQEPGANSKFGAGVSGYAERAHGGIFNSNLYSGLHAYSNMSNGVLGRTLSSDESKAGVFGVSKNTNGVYGLSKNGSGVIGISELGDEMDIVNLDGVRDFSKKNNIAIMGIASSTFGVVGQSVNNSGVLGSSKTSNGVTGVSESEIVDRAAVSGIASENARGVYGQSRLGHGVVGEANAENQIGVWGLSKRGHGVYGNASAPEQVGVWGSSIFGHGVVGEALDKGSGIKGTSLDGKAGEFEGEVHIENGDKKAKLLIQEMEDDWSTPHGLVWSTDKYVRKRPTWASELDNGYRYFCGTYGIKVKNNNTTTYQVNPDGTSSQIGLSTFKGGLEIPLRNNSKLLSVMPDVGMNIFDYVTDSYVFRISPFGDLTAQIAKVYSLEAEIITGVVKNFKIDHPLDPANKNLIHTSIESDERLNIYSGNTMTDSNGYSTVIMPSWFDSLNEDFRYQLTVIGQFAQAIIFKEIDRGQFVIQTNKPNVKVSWQVSGVRHDAWAKAHPNIVETEKSTDEKARYLLIQ